MEETHTHIKPVVSQIDEELLSGDHSHTDSCNYLQTKNNGSVQMSEFEQSPFIGQASSPSIKKQLLRTTAFSIFNKYKSLRRNSVSSCEGRETVADVPKIFAKLYQSTANSFDSEIEEVRDRIATSVGANNDIDINVKTLVEAKKERDSQLQKFKAYKERQEKLRKMKFQEINKQEMIIGDLQKYNSVLENPRGVKDKISYHCHKDNMFYEFKNRHLFPKDMYGANIRNAQKDVKQRNEIKQKLREEAVRKHRSPHLRVIQAQLSVASSPIRELLSARKPTLKDSESYSEMRASLKAADIRYLNKNADITELSDTKPTIAPVEVLPESEGRVSKNTSSVKASERKFPVILSKTSVPASTKRTVNSNASRKPIIKLHPEMLATTQGFDAKNLSETYSGFQSNLRKRKKVQARVKPALNVMYKKRLNAMQNKQVFRQKPLSKIYKLVALLHQLLKLFLSL